MREYVRVHRRSRRSVRLAFLVGLVGGCVISLLHPAVLPAQDAPKLTIDYDCQAFAVSRDNSIVYAEPRIKRIKKLIIERDDIGIASRTGRVKKIVEADKFMPIPPPSGYVVNSLAWGPDGHHFAANITLQQPPPDYEPDKKKKEDNGANDDKDLIAVGGGPAVALLDDDGHEIKVAGSKTRFIEGATNATWLADGATVVYLTSDAHQITRVRPADGQTAKLFEGHGFDEVVWDAARNRAFAVAQNLSLRGRTALVELDLLSEKIREIATLESYRDFLSLAPSGTKIAFFEDGDTIEMIDLRDPSKPVRVRAGLGRFGWSQDERRVLLKRGPEDRSNNLIWVGLYDGSFVPILHDLEFRDFQIAPDGKSLAVTRPGKRVLTVFPLP
jgi:hypothetical protein